MIQQQENLRELICYAINGLVATAVHYGVLTFNVEVLSIPYAGPANLIAAVFGITSSFLGSRYFVFRTVEEPMLTQAMKFSGLYSAIAILHGFVLLLWTDIMSYSYSIGFLIATLIQFLLSYLGNKKWVFAT